MLVHRDRGHKVIGGTTLINSFFLLLSLLPLTPANAVFSYGTPRQVPSASVRNLAPVISSLGASPDVLILFFVIFSLR